jgi:hypothetical protein
MRITSPGTEQPSAGPDRQAGEGVPQEELHLQVQNSLQQDQIGRLEKEFLKRNYISR